MNKANKSDSHLDQARFEYKFVRVKAKAGSDIFTKMNQEESREYQNAILDFSEQGWRFVQAFAPPVTARGRAEFYDLIFERPV